MQVHIRGQPLLHGFQANNWVLLCWAANRRHKAKGLVALLVSCQV